MTLEKKLAEMEVLAKALSKNAKDDTISKEFETFLSGIVAEAEMAYNGYINAMKSIRSKRGSMHIADFGLSIKNMAENLNRFMQNVYAKETNPVLSRLSKSLDNAPDYVGDSLDEIFSVHDFSPESPVKLTRDSRGHGKGHIILEVEGKNSTLVLEDTKMDAKAWLKENADTYFDMVNDALRFMYEKDTEHFEKKKHGSILCQRAKNYVKRHKKTSIITASAALLSIGLAAGYYGGQLKEISEINEMHHRNYGDAAWVVGSGSLMKEGELNKKEDVDSLREKVLYDLSFDVAKGWGHDTVGLHRLYNTDGPIFKRAYKEWEKTDGKTYTWEKYKPE